MFESAAAQFALDAVRQASRLVQRVQREMLGEAITKDDRSPVTVGDFAAQALVARRLADALPGEVLVGEESADVLRDASHAGTLEQITQFVARHIPSATPDDVRQWIDLGTADPEGRFWTLDPIDGTKGFLRGDQYAVALARVEDGVVQLGVLGCPNLAADGSPDMAGPGALFIAERGQGSWTTRLVAEGPSEFKRIAVSDRADPAQARMLRSVEAGHTHGGQIDQIAERLGVAAEPVRMDSQAKYAALAAGAGDVMLRLISPTRPDYREKIWDQAAGSIVVEEAGGRTSDLDGKPFDFRHGRTLATNRGVVVSNGALHDAFLDALAAVGA